MEKLYNINEIFYSLQGEGTHAGSPMVFVRFAGCNLKCEWCDTEHKEIKDTYTKEQLLEVLKKFKHPVICFTGGEPLVQLDSDLLVLLKQNDFLVHIETNGTMELADVGINRSLIDWITVSPKSLKNWKLKNDVDAVKIVFTGAESLMLMTETDKIEGLHYRYLSPLDPVELRGEEDDAYIEQVKLNINTVVGTVLYSARNWTMSVQLHKIIGVK